VAGRVATRHGDSFGKGQALVCNEILAGVLICTSLHSSARSAYDLQTPSFRGAYGIAAVSTEPSDGSAALAALSRSNLI
jgi:hypothetical protein